MKKLGMWLFVLSDTLTFATLLVVYAALRLANPEWPRPFTLAPGIVFATGMTVVLLASSLTMVWAVGAMHRGERGPAVRWLLATQYADGQPMVTATVLVVKSKSRVAGAMTGWSYLSSPDSPLVLDMPVISTRERLTLEAHAGKSPEMTYDFPESNLGADPVEAFKRFYRVFPQFSRVDL